MSNRLARPLLAALCLASTAATAADLVPVADFARRMPLTSPRLSPDGQYVSLAFHDPDGKTHGLAIYRVGDMTKAISLIRMPPYELPADMVWASPTRLVVARGKVDGSIGQARYTGEIMAIDVDGKNADYLFGYEAFGKRAATRATDRGWGTIEGLPVESNGHFYMRATSWTDDNRSTLYDVDAKTSTRKQIADIGLGDMNFMIAPDGTARFAFGTDDNFRWVVFHREGSGWNKLAGSDAQQNFTPVSSVIGSQRIYAKYSPDGKGGAFVEQDEGGGNARVIRQDDFSEVTASGLWTPAPLRPFGTIAATGIPKPTYIDPEAPIAKLHMALSQKFAGQFVSFVDFSQDGGQLMFKVSSDREPGRYMLIDTRTYKVSKLFDALPWIDPAKMAERRPMRFKASDGMELEAILTFPKGRPETSLPMVLMPHGGPHGIADDWFYEDDAQFLANRGYLVLQVNYRGSGGRGSRFEQAGYLQWGTRIQEDLIDGVKFAIAQNFADPQRVCVFGASFGGYSAMMTPVRAPGMFKCAVGYDGVYDLGMMYNKGDIKDRKAGRSYLTTVIGKDDAALAANSPTHLADKIDVPVFLVHGEDDERAPFAQFKAMRAALDAAHKPYETLTKPDERHGFVKPENVEEFYNRLQAFLDKHIGAGAASPARAAP
ncbi:Dipeptidyl aminopeptidase/acylaminoacyl peptidase [Luteibacter sp. UNCMF331Sha3.1]|uniref:alpha/beta hydrolase family protein n=1 Tax=Luteibacter sp. UNCMF331Sha3.1 TaxID=1502760 RepID=UPI0008C6881E|nr:S9 family peptidase [Luteibacter sp. UNCMF331Sha3.1]SEM25336.1 Dipeptidyl aminopeptidase/acylaminoacyl peptidase [Luteibacter sp. UNCMF331Sha3.1]